MFERETSSFQFHNGPVFAQLVLADEINRATPKAQSALLEAMEEHQVTADGQTYPLPNRSSSSRTQNPVYQVGTFPLPESQLDRFLMRIQLGYPEPTLERQLLLGRIVAICSPALPTDAVAAAAAATAGDGAARARLRRAARLRAGNRALHARVAAVRSGTVAARVDRARCAPHKPGR